jgi:hypothetical protein
MSLLNDILVIENCVAAEYQNFIEQQLFADDIPWTFLNNVASNNNEARRSVGFSYSAYSDDRVASLAYWFLYPVLLEACSKLSVVVNQLFRIRVGLYVNINSSAHNDPHVDHDYPHLTGLYYVNDSDGDTVFFESDKITEKLRISPKKGSFVLFDGSIYHASSNPTQHNYRTTVNYNFI